MFVFNRSFFCGGRLVAPGDPVPAEVESASSFRTMRKSRWILAADEYERLYARKAPTVEGVPEPSEPPSMAGIEPVAEIERPPIEEPVSIEPAADEEKPKAKRKKRW